MANWADKTCGYCGFCVTHGDVELPIVTCPKCGVDKCAACGQPNDNAPMCKACAREMIDRRLPIVPVE